MGGGAQRNALAGSQIDQGRREVARQPGVHHRPGQRHILTRLVGSHLEVPHLLAGELVAANVLGVEAAVAAPVRVDKAQRDVALTRHRRLVDVAQVIAVGRRPRDAGEVEQVRRGAGARGKLDAPAVRGRALIRRRDRGIRRSYPRDQQEALAVGAQPVTNPRLQAGIGDRLELVAWGREVRVVGEQRRPHPASARRLIQRQHLLTVGHPGVGPGHGVDVGRADHIPAGLDRQDEVRRQAARHRGGPLQLHRRGQVRLEPVAGAGRHRRHRRIRVEGVLLRVRLPAGQADAVGRQAEGPRGVRVGELERQADHRQPRLEAAPRLRRDLDAAGHRLRVDRHPGRGNRVVERSRHARLHLHRPARRALLHPQNGANLLHGRFASG